MCMGGGSGGGRSRGLLRDSVGRASQRESARRVTESIFNPGKYKIRNTRRYEHGAKSNRTYASDWDYVQVNSFKEKDALLGRQMNIRARGLRNADVDYDNNKFDRKFSVGRWQEASYKGQNTAAVTAEDIKRTKGTGPEFRNVEKNANLNRGKINDDADIKRRARKARGANSGETGYRSRRKSAAQATSGLRIGGSGVNVPGGGVS